MKYEKKVAAHGSQAPSPFSFAHGYDTVKLRMAYKRTTELNKMSALVLNNEAMSKSKPAKNASNGIRCRNPSAPGVAAFAMMFHLPSPRDLSISPFNVGLTK